MAASSIWFCQVRFIHVLKSALKMDDDTYRNGVLASYGVKSSKQLTYDQAAQLISKLEDQAVAAGVWQKKDQQDPKKRFDELKGREDRASPAQLRKLEAMWMSISRLTTREEKEKALNHFIKRITGVDHISWMTAVDVRKVIKAIESMNPKPGGAKC